MNDFIVVFVTAGSPEEGERIARALVEEKLAACVNRIAGIRSIYRWQGNVEKSDEDLLVIKTRRDLFDRLKERVGALHSYDVPEIIALPIVNGNEGYLEWLSAQLPGSDKK